MQGSIMAQCAQNLTVQPGFVISARDTVHRMALRKPTWLLKERTRSGWLPPQH